MLLDRPMCSTRGLLKTITLYINCQVSYCRIDPSRWLRRISHFGCLLILFNKMALNAVLLDLIAPCKTMLVRAGDAADADVAVDSLNGPKLLSKSGQIVHRSRKNTQLFLSGGGKNRVRSIERLDTIKGHITAVIQIVQRSPRKVFGDFDFDIAEVQLPRNAISPLLVRII